ncbi:MAG: urea ABC transporter ATP-binding subunit UrtE [Comamonas sp.]
MLELDGVHSYYDRSHALHGMRLSVPRGGITAVLGRNGMGKTTLLKTLMGLEVRSEGRITFDGQAIEHLPTHLRAQRGLAYVPQGRGIIPDFTVRQNIEMGGFAARPRALRIPEIVGELFPYLMANLDRPGGVLSGGQQQQLAIARALASAPRVMLLDEPNEGIQPSIVEQIERAIVRLNRELGLTLVLVEQNLAFARQCASDFAMLEKGTVKAQGPIATLTQDVVDRYLTI